MPISELRLIKHSLEYLPFKDSVFIPRKTRGIYVLYKKVGKANDDSHHYNVVYVGMARSSIRARINSHKRNKVGLWTHFSMFEVWDNIREDEIEELEGLFRHLYRYDKQANSLNQQKAYKKLKRVTKKTESEWLNE